MDCDLCEVPMTVWNFTNKVYHCPNCGNVEIED
jgi:predicted RNA-binding Zn-ribbon protein involved in translation (DUF1610 family)